MAALGRRGRLGRGDHTPRGERRGHSARAPAPRSTSGWRAAVDRRLVSSPHPSGATSRRCAPPGAPALATAWRRRRLGVRWQRATPWSPSPDPASARKNPARSPEASGGGPARMGARLWRGGLVEWPGAARPAHLGPDAQALPSVANTRPPAAREPPALACDGRLVRATPTTPAQGGRRGATGQPVSGLTTPFLAWCGDRLGGLGKRALLVWDTASWPQSQAGRTGLRTHHRRVKQPGCGVRRIAGRLPRPTPLAASHGAPVAAGDTGGGRTGPRAQDPGVGGPCLCVFRVCA